jgi:hypothetical protein
MYHLNSTLPAPYELSNTNSMNSMSNPEVPNLAKGGRAKHKKILAHFNRKELDVMDHLQGGTERCPKTGVRSFSHLEELFKNPHLVGTIHKHVHAHRAHHAMGGNIDHMAHEGRHGDTEMALIGPHTMHAFHQVAGKSTVNPHTGQPEFWSMGPALSSLGGALKGAGSAAARGISNAARSAAPVLAQGAKTLGSGALSAAKAAAPHVGTAFNTLAPIAAEVGTQFAANRLRNMNRAPEEQEEFNPAESLVSRLPQSMQGVGQAGLGAYNAYRGGASPQQAFGQGLSQYGQQYGGTAGNAMQGFGGAMSRGQDFRSSLGSAASRVGQGYGGAAGNALQAAGQSFGSGQDWRQSLNQGAQRGFQDMGGRRGLVNSAANILGGYGSEGGMRGAAQREAQGYMNRALPSYYPQQQESYNPYEDQGYGEEDYGYGY